ncbi:MAG: tetratricopeptide repeat protein [Calditrichaeota bacterium]|nr:MAG: tetratricopeptide repeat protein [Calditrichota bacterium]
MGKHLCLPLADLLSYATGRKGKAGEDEHLRNCSLCRDRMHFTERMVRQFREAGNMPSLKSEPPESEHLSSELMERYFQGDLDKGETVSLYTHLCICDACFDEVSGVGLDAFAEPTDEERAVLDALAETSVPDRLEPYKIPFRIRRRRSRWADMAKVLGARPVLSGAIALAIVVVVALFGLREYRTHQAAIEAENAFAQAVARNRIPDNVPRPTGGFQFTLIPRTRSSENTLPKRLSMEAVQRALRLDPRNARWNHYLGTLYFFSGEMEKAREYYLKALTLDGSNAKVYNDLALIDFDRKDFSAAIEHLQQALRLDPNLQEALYNLALIYEVAGDPGNAIRTWRKYLQLDSAPESQWRKIARSHLDKLNSR